MTYFIFLLFILYITFCISQNILNNTKEYGKRNTYSSKYKYLNIETIDSIDESYSPQYKYLNVEAIDSIDKSYTHTTCKNREFLEHQKLTWHDYREMAFETYGRCCAKCGSNEELQIHHIIPISKGGTNDLTNLIPLCRKCHEKIHKFKFKENYKQIPQNYGKKISKKNKILKAIKLNKQIKIKYKASRVYKNSEITQRVVRPIEIILGKYCDNKYVKQSNYDIDKPFLLAYCELRKEKRLFRLDRILEISEI